MIMSVQIEQNSYSQSCVGRLDDIHTAVKPLKKIERNFHDHFRTS